MDHSHLNIKMELEFAHIQTNVTQFLGISTTGITTTIKDATAIKQNSCLCLEQQTTLRSLQTACVAE